MITTVATADRCNPRWRETWLNTHIDTCAGIHTPKHLHPSSLYFTITRTVTNSRRGALWWAETGGWWEGGVCSLIQLARGHQGQREKEKDCVFISHIVWYHHTPNSFGTHLLTWLLCMQPDKPNLTKNTHANNPGLFLGRYTNLILRYILEYH